MASVFRSALDLTVVDNVLREWPGQDGKPVYGRLPAKAAQQTLRNYLASWGGYFQLLKRFAAGGSAITGQPRPPGYLAKHSRFVLELPLTQMGELLIGLGARRIPTDFDESLALTEAELTSWNSYRIRGAVATACTRRGFTPTCEPQHLRIVPHKAGVKFEGVRFIADMEYLGKPVLQVLQEVDPSFQRKELENETAINDKGFMVEFLRRVPQNGDPHPFKFSEAEEELWPVQARRAQILTEAPPFEHIVIGATGKMALMRTISPKVFVEFKKWLSAQPSRNVLKRRRDLSQAQIVQTLLDEGLLLG